VRPVLLQMISSNDKEIVETGAHLCCLLGLGVDAAKEDAEMVRTGNEILRKGAVTIYATNVANKEVGAQCRNLLLPFFADGDDNVRAEAANAFHHVSKLETTGEQGALLAAFLDGKPNGTALGPVIRAIEDSPMKLPDLVCRLVEAGIQAFKADAGDVRQHGAMVAGDLSKIVIRLYTQSDDEHIRKRCLDAIDRMEEAGFFGLSDELGRLDR
jgi:hypothetical protein